MFQKITCLIFLICSVTGVITAQNKLIPFNSPSIRYEGRILYKNDAAELSWSGTSVDIWFKGSSISAVLKDTDTADYYNIIIDDSQITKIHPDTPKRTFLLAAGLKKGKHHAEIFKRTEWDKGKTIFYGFETPEKTIILSPPAAKKRKIEFYGNSITCGYGIEDNKKDSGIGFFENNYLSYAAITARYFDAQYSCISKSGIGILISWFPLIMREMFDRLDPEYPSSKWDFKKFTPDVVVINLFQNDSWLIEMPDHEQFKFRFGTKAPDESIIISSYTNFVASIRDKYPDASIICVLGNMDATREGSLWPSYIEKAVNKVHDSNIFTHFFKYVNSNGHPEIADQQAMAVDLIGFIEKNIKW